MMWIRHYRCKYVIKDDIFIESQCEIAVVKVCLLVVEDFDSLVPCLKLKMTSSFVSAWVTLCPNMTERCRHKKCHLGFILFVYALFGAPSGRAYAQYSMCRLFMTMNQICDDISYHE